MAKKKIDKYNVFGEGGEMPLASKVGAGLGIATAGATGFFSGMQNPNAANYVNQVNTYGNYNPAVGNYDDLMSAYSSLSTMDPISQRDITGAGNGKQAMGIANATLSGAAAGAKFGPWGAAIGAGIGLIGSGVGTLVGNNKAKKQAAQLNNKIETINANKAALLNNAAANINTQRNYNALANYAAYGGQLFADGGNMDTMTRNGGIFGNGLTFVGNGGTHEENPIGGVPMGVDQEGNPNLVEEGEVIWNDYVFSNRLTVPKEVAEKYKLGKNVTFADAVKKAQKPSAEMPNDPIEARGLNTLLATLAQTQEALKQEEAMKQQVNMFAEGGMMDGDDDTNTTSSKKPTSQSSKRSANSTKTVVNSTIPSSKYFSVPMEYGDSPLVDSLTGSVLAEPFSENIENRPTMPYNLVPEMSDERYRNDVLWYKRMGSAVNGAFFDDEGNSKINPVTMLRYAPALGSGMAMLTDAMGITNTPDYTHANRLEEYANSIPNESYTPIGNYLTYKPFDTDYAANTLAATASANRNAIRNIANSNRATAMAGILGADYNAINQLGALYKTAEQYNAEQRKAVADFNRATDVANREGASKIAAINAERDKIRFEALQKSLAMKDASDTAAYTARAANTANFFDTLGNIGKENFAMNMVNSNYGMLYGINPIGNLFYQQPALTETPQTGTTTQPKSAITTATKAKGGYLTIKKRKKGKR